MASFNPTIGPTNDPNYLKYTDDVKQLPSLKPTGQEANTIQPKGITHIDQSGEYAAKGAAYDVMAQAQGTENFGNLVKGGVQALDFAGKAVDTLVKKQIEDSLFKDLDTERSKYTEELLSFLQPGGQPRAVSPARGVQAPSSDAASDAPAALQQLPNQLNILNEAMIAGKINRSFYDGKLAEIAKDYRSRYPGYREFIDSKVSSIVGVDPANKRVSDLTAGVNALLAGSKDTQKDTLHALDRMAEAGVTGAAIKRAQFKAGQLQENDAWSWVNDQNAQQWQNKKMKDARENFKGSVEDLKFMDENNFAKLMPQTIQNALDVIKTPFGSAAEMQKRAYDMSTGLVAKPDPQQAREFGMAIKALQPQVEAIAFKKAQEMGWTNYNSIGMDEVRKRIKLQSQPIADLGEMVFNQQWGLATFAHNRNADIQDRAIGDLLQNKDIGKLFAIAHAANSAGGPLFADAITNPLMGDARFTDALKQYIGQAKMEMAGQPNKNTTGEVSTLKQTTDHAQANNVKNPAVYDELVNGVDMITDPKVADPAKSNIIEAYFSPLNRGLLAKDWVDKQGKNRNTEIFLRLTKPDITNEVFKQGQTDGKSWKFYTDSMQYMFANELLPKEIKQLSEIQAYPKYKLGWDSENNRIELAYNNKPITEDLVRRSMVAAGSENADIRMAPTFQSSIERINSMLSRYKDVIKKDPGLGDPSEYLVKTLMTANRNIDIEQWGGVPKMILDAMKTSRATEALKKQKWSGE